MLLRKLLLTRCLIVLGTLGLATWQINSCGAADEAKVPKKARLEKEVFICAYPVSNRGPQMVDGPGMINPNFWKHQVLNGAWMAPEGDLALKISEFNYEFGIYKLGEPDNFRWLQDRFYFDGSQRTEDRDQRFDLKLSGEPKIMAADGTVLLELEEMWHEKRSIFVKVKFPGAEGFKVRELRKPETFSE